MSTEATITALKDVVDKHFGPELLPNEFIHTSIGKFIDESAITYGQLGLEKPDAKTRREERWQTALCADLFKIATGLSGEVTQGLAAECFTEGSALPKEWKNNPQTVKSLLFTMGFFEEASLKAWRIDHDPSNAAIKVKEEKLMAFLRDLQGIDSLGEGQVPAAKK